VIAMRVALEFGRLDVDAMLEEISASQLAEWAAFFALRNMSPEEQKAAAMRQAISNDRHAEAEAMKGLLRQIGVTRERARKSGAEP